MAIRAPSEPPAGDAAAAGSAGPADSAVASAAAAALAAGRAAWPDLAVDPAAFAAHLARCVAGEPDPAAALAALRADDLHLAFACAAGDPRALAAFDARHRPELLRTLARVRMDGDPADVIQDLWTRLFAPGAAKILDYRGRGDLRGWLRAAALRAAYRAARNDHRTVALDDATLADRVGLDRDPALAHLQSTYRAELKRAFERALAALTARDRTLLRRHHLDGMSVDDLASLYRVHRATAARWVARARDALVESTLAHLRAHLLVDTATLDSILRLVRSQLDLSLARLLAPNRK